MVTQTFQEMCLQVRGVRQGMRSQRRDLDSPKEKRPLRGVEPKMLSSAGLVQEIMQRSLIHVKRHVTFVSKEGC